MEKCKRMEEFGMKSVDNELVGLCGLIALVAALGVVAVVLVFTGMRIETCSHTVLAASYCSLSGIFWGTLLIFNLGEGKK